LSWYARCLVLGVPKTEVPNLLFLLPGSKCFRRFLVVLLTMAATSEFGQESVLTLAKVRLDQPPAKKPAVIRKDSAPKSFGDNASAPPRLQQQVAAAKPDNQKATNFPPDYRFEKQGDSNQRDLLQFVHKKLSMDGQTCKWVDVAAGYGHVYGAESGLKNDSVELEQPGRAYLKASFSF
jgi:hypothetical protein